MFNKINVIIIVYLILIATWGMGMFLLPEGRSFLYVIGILIFLSSFFIVMGDSKNAFRKDHIAKK